MSLINYLSKSFGPSRLNYAKINLCRIVCSPFSSSSSKRGDHGKVPTTEDSNLRTTESGHATGVNSHTTGSKRYLDLRGYYQKDSGNDGVEPLDNTYRDWCGTPITSSGCQGGSKGDYCSNRKNKHKKICYGDIGESTGDKSCEPNKKSSAPTERKKVACQKYKEQPCAKPDAKKGPCASSVVNDAPKKIECQKAKNQPCAKPDDKNKGPCANSVVNEAPKKVECQKAKNQPCAKPDDKNKGPCANSVVNESPKKNECQKTKDQPCAKPDDKNKGPCANSVVNEAPKKNDCQKTKDQPCAKADDKKGGPCGNSGAKEKPKKDDCKDGKDKVKAKGGELKSPCDIFKEGRNITQCAEVKPEPKKDSKGDCKDGQGSGSKNPCDSFKQGNYKVECQEVTKGSQSDCKDGKSKDPPKEKAKAAPKAQDCKDGKQGAKESTCRDVTAIGCEKAKEMKAGGSKKGDDCKGGKKGGGDAGCKDIKEKACAAAAALKADKGKKDDKKDSKSDCKDGKTKAEDKAKTGKPKKTDCSRFKEEMKAKNAAPAKCPENLDPNQGVRPDF